MWGGVRFAVGWRATIEVDEKDFPALMKVKEKSWATASVTTNNNMEQFWDPILKFASLPHHWFACWRFP